VVRATATYGDTVIKVDGTPRAVTGEEGHFSILGLPPGWHSFEAVRPANLTSRKLIQLPTDGLVDLGPTLLELGDAFADNQVDIIDAELVRSADGRCRGGAGTYQAFLDMNGDGCIDRADYLIVLDNLGKVGPTMWGIPPP